MTTAEQFRLHPQCTLTIKEIKIGPQKTTVHASSNGRIAVQNLKQNNLRTDLAQA
jgi:hypothetical protein